MPTTASCSRSPSATRPGLPAPHHGNPRDGQRHARGSAARFPVLHAVRLRPGLLHRRRSRRRGHPRAADVGSAVAIQQGHVRPRHQVRVRHVHRGGGLRPAPRAGGGAQSGHRRYHHLGRVEGRPSRDHDHRRGRGDRPPVPARPAAGARDDDGPIFPIAISTAASASTTRSSVWSSTTAPPSRSVSTPPQPPSEPGRTVELGGVTLRLDGGGVRAVDAAGNEIEGPSVVLVRLEPVHARHPPVGAIAGSGGRRSALAGCPG